MSGRPHRPQPVITGAPVDRGTLGARMLEASRLAAPSEPEVGRILEEAAERLGAPPS